MSADIKTTDTRPWGSYRVVESGPGSLVKIITVLAGKRFSLQYHEHREEDWLIISGTGIITRDSTSIPFGPGTVVNIPVRAIHRLEADSAADVVFVEVQRGQDLREDDIFRLSDDFGRS